MNIQEFNQLILELAESHWVKRISSSEYNIIVEDETTLTIRLNHPNGGIGVYCSMGNEKWVHYRHLYSNSNGRFCIDPIKLNHFFSGVI